MAGLDDLLGWVTRALDVAPRYEARNCLAVTYTRGECRECLNACPHEAVTINPQVAIDKIDCTGCGICVQACPSGALEPRVSFESGSPMRCSKVAGGAQSVLCLARLQATDVVRLAGSKPELTLAHGDCEGCNVGSAAVPALVAKVADDAVRLAATHGRQLKVKVERLDSLDHQESSERISRRSIFSGILRGAREQVADSLAPLERILPKETEDDEGAPLPVELSRRYQLIELAKPAAETLVPWSLPRVADGCILCPLCTRACPTDAFSRNLGEGFAAGLLLLEPERCIGCNACVDACPVQVISMDNQVSWGELSGGKQEAYRADPSRHRPDLLPR